MSSAATEKPIESCLAQNAFSGGRRGQWRPARGSSSLRTARCRHWSLPALSSPKACIVRHQGVSRQRKTLPGAGSNRQAARPCHQWRARRKRPKLRCLRSPCTDPRHRGLAYDNLLGACGAATRLGPSERLKHARGLAKNVQPGSEPEPGSQRWDSDEHRDMVACRRVHEGPTERIQSTAGSPSARREHRRRHGRRFRRGVHGRSTAWATKTNHAQSASGFPLLSVLLSLRPESASRGNKRTCPPPPGRLRVHPDLGQVVELRPKHMQGHGDLALHSVCVCARAEEAGRLLFFPPVPRPAPRRNPATGGVAERAPTQSDSGRVHTTIGPTRAAQSRQLPPVVVRNG